MASLRLMRFSFTGFKNIHQRAKVLGPKFSRCLASKSTKGSNVKEANVSEHIFNIGTSRAERKIFFEATSTTKGTQKTSSYTEQAWSQDIDNLHNEIDTFYSEDPEVHRLLDNAQSSLSSGTRSSEIVNQVFHQQYNYYIKTLPWLHRNYDIAYIQFLMNNHKALAFDYIWNNPNMKVLMDELAKEVDTMPTLELLNTYLGLLYLGLSTENGEEVQLALHMACLERSKEFTLEELDIFGSVIRSSKDRLFGYKSCLPKLQQIIEDEDYQWTSKDLYHLASISTLYHFILSSDSLDAIHSKIISMAEDESLLTDPDLLAQLLRCSKRLRVLVEQSEVLPTITPAVLRSHIVRMSRATTAVIHKLEPEHIAEMCDSLKRIAEYPKELAELFENRALQLKGRENIKLADLSNLMFALRVDSKYSTKKLLANSVCTQIQNADVLILSDLAPCINDSRLSHHAIAATYLAVIPHHVDNLFSFITRIYKIVTCIQNFRSTSIQLRQQFAQALVSTYSRRRKDVYVPITLAVIGSFVIPHCKFINCEPLLSDIARSLPQWNMRALYHLSMGLNRALSNGSKSLCLKLSPLVDNFYSAMMAHTRDISSFGMLYSIAMATIISTPQRDPNFTHQMMALVPQYSQVLNSKQNFIQVVSMMTQLQYYLPKVYDDLAAFLVQKREELHLEKSVFFAFIRSLSLIGYLPPNNEELIQYTLEGLEEIQEDPDSIAKQLSVLRNLCYLQILPEQQLQQLFTLETVEKVDQFLGDAGKVKQESVEEMMMELNRFVAVECPQLDIPWFHDDYCQKKLASEKTVYENLAMRQFRAELGQALVEIVKDPKYFKAKSHSPYYHHIDFEVVTDKKGKLMSQEQLKSAGDKELQRHSVLILNKDNFCYDSKHLLGAELVRKRHLQILGYNVVDISHYEWYSMGLTDWNAKVEYLEKKLRL